jgi:ribosomal protein L3 glutamine methyltransferase
MTTEHLVTIRDYLRFAVSRFHAAKLEHGHGVSSALDEAAFLILETLNLPVDDINPWLDARLLPAERDKLAGIIEARITTRKPAAYLTKRTYIHGVPFYVDERVIVPRSYIGELLFSGLFGGDGHNLIKHLEKINSVLDLCTGSGCLAILAARIFPNASIDAVDLSADALDVARINVKDHELEQRITLHQGDLFAPLGSRKYDLIITNPPYVAEAEVAAFPKEYAHEPVIAHAGGRDGLDITRRLLAEAPKHLNKGGGLLCEIGTGREILEREFPKLNFLWLDTEESSGEVFWLTF